MLFQDHCKDLPHHTLSLTKDVHEMKSTQLPSITKDVQDIKQKMDDLQKLLESLVKTVAAGVIACSLCFCGSASLHEWLLHVLVKCFFTVTCI